MAPSCWIGRPRSRGNRTWRLTAPVLGAGRGGYLGAMLLRSVRQGLVAGLVGTTVMTVAEKLEQQVTGRPSAYVPARVLERVVGLPDAPSHHTPGRNWAMHFGQGALVGIVRSLMANAGLRGPLASAKFAVVRLTTD